MARIKIEPTRILLLLAVAAAVIMLFNAIFPNFISFIYSLSGDGAVEVLQVNLSGITEQVGMIGKVIIAFLAIILTVNVVEKSKSGFTRKDFFTMVILAFVLFYLLRYVTGFLDIPNPLDQTAAMVQAVIGG